VLRAAVASIPLICLALGAQNAPESKDVAVNELVALLNTKVISATKLPQIASEAPGVVAVFNRDVLRVYGWDSINDVLYKQPGFSPSMDYDRRTVSSRGIFEGWNNNHLLTLVDGVPVNDDIYGSAYTSEVTPLWMVKSLELLRGPGSALYGSNAMNGLINLRTVGLEDIQGLGEAKLSLGNDGIRTFDGLVGTHSRLFDVITAFTANRTYGDEYPSSDLSGRADANGNPARFLVKDHRENTYFFMKLEGQGDLNGFTLQFHDQRWQFNTGHGWVFVIPDVRELMTEDRQILSLSYTPANLGNLSQEYILRYQRHGIDWNQRYFPDGVSGYPAGLWESLETHTQDLFSRAQITYRLPASASVVAGVEADRFTYGGDDLHQSNIDINQGGTFQPFTPDNQFRPLQPWLQYIQDQPLVNTALYLQLSSGEFLGKRFALTLGARSDRQSFDFNAIDRPAGGTESKSFSQTSPRVGLVFKATDALVFKVLSGKAFRAPSAAEMFGANTYSLASNVRQLRPEFITTSEVAMDWTISPHLAWRVNAYRTKFENQIDYSPSNANLSTNLYSPTNQGVETELLWNLGPWNGFVNDSWVHRVNDRTSSLGITPSPDKVVWVPATTLNAGAAYQRGPWTASLNGHYQGAVQRRSSDFGAYAAYRSAEVEPWSSIDIRVAYRFDSRLEGSLWSTNVGGTHGALIKKFDAPFDYRIEPRRWGIAFRITL
jgi:outer membrane receptor protein involved in Fe transport